MFKVDELAKRLQHPFAVIPEQAGIQYFQVLINTLDPGFQPSDDFLRNHQNSKPLLQEFFLVIRSSNFDNFLNFDIRISDSLSSRSLTIVLGTIVIV